MLAHRMAGGHMLAVGSHLHGAEQLGTQGQGIVARGVKRILCQGMIAEDFFNFGNLFLDLLRDNCCVLFQLGPR